MPYSSGTWGEKAKARSKKRLEYFRKYVRKYIGHPAGLGFKGELLALNILKGSVLIRKKYDLDWNEFKVDVKTSMVINRRNQLGKDNPCWKFSVRRQRGIVDFYLLLCLGEEGKLMKKYLIPEKYITVNTLSLGIHRSRYDEFLMREESELKNGI